MQGKEFLQRLRLDTEALDAAGLLKRERVIGSAQGPVITLADGREMINLCANNYLGLANHPAIVKAAQEGLARYGYGVASVRFICGTQTVHRELEERLSAYLSMEDTILYSSCFDANGGLFETLLDEQDAVISDALNHASIIDGIRLCKARRLRYANNDMNELEQALKDSQDARVRLIATDGVFSMDGSIARLNEICDLADALFARWSWSMIRMPPASSARAAAASHELRGVIGRIDILTSTLGKALGGASGGFVVGAQGNRRLAAPAFAAVSVLEQHRARRSLPPPFACSTCWRVRRSCASDCTRTPATFVSGMQAWASI